MKRISLASFAIFWLGLMFGPWAVEFAAPQQTITGRVIDSVTRAPIPNADVRIQASLTEQATTGTDGAFTLRTTRAAGEVVTIGAGALDAEGTRANFYNSKLSVLVGDSGIEIQLVPAAMGDDQAYEFANPQDCRLCHGTLYDYWQDSAHRNAAKNTWVRDMYDGQGTPGTGGNGFVYKDMHPGFKGDCAECHAPMDSAKNPGDNTDFSTITPFAREFGVSCDVCHKTYDISNIKLPGVQGMLMARSSRETIFGPLPDSAPNFPGVMRASYSKIHTTGLLCASCHEDNNDHDFDLDYLDEGSVVSEETWTEWLASPYATPGPGLRTCMDCHMTPKGDRAMCEQYQPVTRDPSQVYSHDFEGTTDEFVQNAATLRAIARRDESTLRISVAVTNDRTGHDLPGGQAIRHAILIVTARDGNGGALEFVAGESETVSEIGGTGDPGQGYYAGQPGKAFAKVFGNADETGVFFTEATRIVSDNRIPAGFTDWSDYAFALPDGFEPASITAKLIYRRAPRELVDLKGWVTTGHGRPNPDLIGPNFGVVMAADAHDVAIPGPEVNRDKVVNSEGLRLRIVTGSLRLFAQGAQLAVTDPTGVWVPFDALAKVAGSGQKLTQKGKIGGLKLNQFWPSGAVRFLRVTHPDGSETIMRLQRTGSKYVPV
ncbi:MAG: multiheme c-type cytochrome [Blastocatellia bacterium]